MKRMLLVLAVEVTFTAALLGQMADMPHTAAPAQKPMTTAEVVHRYENMTFTKDIAPIVQQHCQGCHRPGEGTPFSLMTYESAKDWTEEIKYMVQSRQMPPWYEDGTTEHFENNRRLTQDEIDRIVSWIDAGAPKGDPKDLPPPRHFDEGWTIPKPDLIFQIPKPIQVPAKGIMEYQYVILPTGFTKDTWVQDVEAAPTDRSVVHHIVAYVRAPGSNYFKDQPKNTFFEAPPSKTDAKAPKDDVPTDWLVGYAPGQPPDMFKPGQAKLIPAGSDIVLELHYMPEGKATQDQARLGLVLAKQPPAERTMTLSAGNETFKIPPGDPNFRVDASYYIPQDVTLLGMHPHMHMRGKDAQYRIVYPNGETKVVLNVPHYNWRWQLWYNLEQPILLPKGSKLECTEHFDNSKGNPENPDPTKTVIWGQQSTDEMMVCMFNVAFPANMSAKDLLSTPRPAMGTEAVAKLK